MALAGCALAAACARRPPPAPPEPPPKLVEQRLPPTVTVELELSPPRETRSADGLEVFVEGAVRNRGSKPTREVRVTVRGLDAQGAVVAEAEALPTPQLIPPGGRATYLVRLPDDPAIRTYKATAIGR